MSNENVLANLREICEVVADAYEETFVLFSQTLPANDLGIVDPKALHIDLEVGGHDYVIQQSSSLLRSTREAGTTGAVLWKVTPLLAEWLASKHSVLWSNGLLASSSKIVELGCGISGLLGLTISPYVASYVLTDQEYIMKLLRQNITANQKVKKSQGRASKHPKTAKPYSSQVDTLHMVQLDWERDSVENLAQAVPDLKSIDLVVLCDCIYNIYLIKPLLQTCIDICNLSQSRSTVVLIAQQLRTDEVFEQWVTSLLDHFWVYRIKDQYLPINLSSSSGYVVHLAVLR